jgi:hypothetical protein
VNVPEVLNVPPFSEKLPAVRLPVPLSAPPFNDSDESATSTFRLTAPAPIVASYDGAPFPLLGKNGFVDQLVPTFQSPLEPFHVDGVPDLASRAIKANAARAVTA